MKNSEDVEDPLKSLNEICSPDPRQKNFSGSLSDRHSILSEINLHVGVPVDVRQLFETAKNLCLYTWFVYRFHQVAELQAYVTLEMALKTKFISQYPDEKVPTLAKLLKTADDERWINNERFPSLMFRAKRNAWSKKNLELAQEHDFDSCPELVCQEPTEIEVAEALADLDIVRGITSTANKLRNNLAHGSTTLHPNSMSTLKIVSEVINQLFEDR
ncbi:hypothetical protein [Rheinheimera sp. WS51]|uniref:hypothetical protein n=1 Tax=Rheinheimera sp. WS51 TaxID=3425886 RepID=UPI003D8C4CA1